MTVQDPKIIRALAELGIDVTPKTISPDVQKVLDRLNQFEQEMGKHLNPQTLKKYLG